jgi:hypothetical protein
MHESGHFFAAILVGAKQLSLHHNYVYHIDDGLTKLEIIFIKMSGPIVDIFIGTIFHYLCTRDRSRNIWFLLKLYFASFGYIGFFGYMMVAPFFTNGDSGYVCKALGFPLAITILCSVTGVLFLYFLMKKLMKFFVAMGTKEIIENQRERKKFMSQIILLPILLGILITTLLNLPVVTTLSLIAPICMPFSFLWAYGDALNKKYAIDNYNNNFNQLNSINLAILSLFLLVVTINRLMVFGIAYQ